MTTDRRIRERLQCQYRAGFVDASMFWAGVFVVGLAVTYWRVW